MFGRTWMKLLRRLGLSGRFAPCRHVFVVLAIVALGSEMALSQSVRVTSGEHADFSRIVIRFDRETEWRLRDVEEGYLIEFDPRPPKIDLSAVFNLIPRDRIKDLVQSDEGGDLLIVSDCACHAEIFEAARWTVAIDVKDGEQPDEWLESEDQNPIDANPVQGTPGPADEQLDPSGSLGTFEPRANASSRTRDGLSRRLPAPPPFGQVEIAVPLLPWPRAFDAEERSEDAQDNASADDGVDPKVSEPLAPGNGKQATHSIDASSEVPRSTIMRQLQRASTAGWLQLSTDEASLWSDASSEGADGIELDQASSRLDRLSENLEFRSLFDLLDEQGASVPADRTQCLPDHELAFLRAETLEGDGMQLLPSLRANLVDERGAVVPSAARALMEHYLAMGFGAEAAALVPMARLERPSMEMFRSLARIVDTGSDAAPEVWDGQQACDSAAALWAVLGQRDGLRGPNVNVMAVQRAFFDLDMRLRAHLGDDLADKLDALGHDEAAQAIRSNIDPLTDAGPEISPEVAPGAAERAVSELLDRVQESIRLGSGVSQQDLDLAESLAWEYEGTEAGLKLRGMSALGRLERNDLEGAMSLLETQWQGADPAWTQTLEDGFALVVMGKGDADMLRFALHPESDAVLALLEPDQSLELARRLTGLGFPGRALEVLDAGAAANEFRETPERRRLRAGAILATGDPMRALALVAGLDDPSSARIRAEAHMSLENYALASDAYATAGDTDAAARAAWMSGDPAVIAMNGTESQKALAAELDLAATDAPVPPPAPGEATGIAALPAGTVATTEPGSDVGAGVPAVASPFASPPFPTPQTEVPTLAEARALLERSAVIRNSLDSLLPEDG